MKPSERRILKYKGVCIYNIYKCNIYENGVTREYHYGYTGRSNDYGKDTFDIRDLPNYDSNKSHIDMIKEAIDKGYIARKPSGVKLMACIGS